MSDPYVLEFGRIREFPALNLRCISDNIASARSGASSPCERDHAWIITLNVTKSGWTIWPKSFVIRSKIF